MQSYSDGRFFWRALYVCKKRKKCEDFEINKFCSLERFVFHSNAFIPAVVFYNVSSFCIWIYEPDPAHFHNAPRLTWEEALKQAKIKLENFHFNIFNI